jgi:hypothetical protein
MYAVDLQQQQLPNLTFDVLLESAGRFLCGAVVPTDAPQNPSTLSEDSF